MKISLVAFLAAFASDIRKVYSQYTPTSGVPLVAGGPADTGYLLDADLGSGLTSFSLFYDIYLSATQPNMFGGLIQLDSASNSNDGELFLRDNEDGTFGIGISGNYDGGIKPETWTRIAFTFLDNANGSSRLDKFVNGELVDTQIVETSRHRVNPADGVLIMTDNDNEVMEGRISTFALVARALSNQEVQAIGGASPGGIFAGGSEGVTEFDFTGGLVGGILPARVGEGSLIGRSVKIYQDESGAPFASEGPDGGFILETDFGTGFASYTLIYDLFVADTQPGAFGGLFQTDGVNLSDGDLFLRSNDDNTFGIGISGQYDGAVLPKQWTRIAFTINDLGNGSARLAKFVQGALVGEQTVETSRFGIVPENGIIILADNDFETFNGRIGLFALIKRALTDAEVIDLRLAVPGSIVGDSPADAIEFDFTETNFVNGVAEATVGKAMLSRRNVELTFEADSGIAFSPQGPEGGYRVVADFGNEEISSYSFFFDIVLDATQPGTFGGLLQLDGENSSDGELFARDNSDGTFSIGISGDYTGTVLPGQWARLGFTIRDNGDGSSRLGKFIDGELVGEQAVESTRFRISPGKAPFILTDNDGETFSGRLATFAGAVFALTDEEVASLGRAAPGGILSGYDEGLIIEFNLDVTPFRDGQVSASLGSGSLVDRAFVVTLAPESGSPFVESGPEGGFALAADFGAGVTTYSLLFDIYVPLLQPGSFGGLIQTDATQSGDGDLFLRQDQDGSFSIGISGVYDGIVPPNQWTRIAFTILDQGDGNSRLAKFVDGTLVGEQTVESQRYFIDPANGLLLFNDNDFETFNGRVAAFALVFSALSDATIADLGGADLGAFFQDGSEGIVQFDFQRAPFRNGQMLATLGEGILTDRLFSEVYAEDAGIPFTNQDEDGGFRLDADYGSGITSFTLVYDLILDAVQPRGFGGLIQLDGVNLSDGDLFFRDDGDGTFGIGISGDYDGPVFPDQWTRIVFTFQDLNDGNSRLAKFANGVFLDEQPVTTSRHSIDPTNGVILMTDDNAETWNGRLGAFALVERSLTDAEVEQLGVAKRGGIFAAEETGVLEFDFVRENSFINGRIRAVIGDALLVDRVFKSEYGPDDGASFSPLGPGGGLRLSTDYGMGVPSYTLVFDLWLDAVQPGSFGSLIQTDGENSGDGDLFLRDNGDGTFGIGISGDYDGAISPETWTRIAFTIDSTDDSVSRLAKFIDGILVGEQEVENTRFAIDPARGLLFLTDNDGETFSGRIATFALVFDVTSDEEIAALGAAIPGGLFAKDSTNVVEFVFEDDSFEDGEVEAVIGDAILIDRSFNPVPVLKQITHKLLTLASTVIVNLTEVFQGSSLTYAVAETVGDAVKVTVEGPLLTLSAQNLGFTDVSVTATDAFGGVGKDSFRVRVTGPNAYSFVVLPDTQNYSDFLPGTFLKMTQWLAENKDDQKIEMVLHVGDITENNNAAQWAVASAAYEAIDNTNIPYTLLPGNHDESQGGSARDYTTNMNTVFDKARYFAAAPGDVYDGEPDSIANNYKLITTRDDTNWIVISIEFGARDDVLRWVNDVLDQYPDRVAIILNHHVVNMADINAPHGEPFYGESQPKGSYGIRDSVEGANDGLDMWDKVFSKHASISFIFSGHVFGDGAETIIRYTEMGNPIHQILVNYQNGVNREIQNAGNPNGNGNGGNGAMRILIIDPDNDIVHTETYFVELDKFLSGSRGDPTPSRDGMGNRPEADDGSNNIQLVVFGTTNKLGFAPIPGDDGSAEIIALPFFNPQNGLRVEPGFAPAGGGRLYETYTLIWDVFIPVVIGLTSILQTDLTNNSDGDFWIQRDSEGNGLIGADSQDDGPFELGTWSRVVVVFEKLDQQDIAYRADKYVNGELMGTQVFEGDRRTVKAGGFLLFADEGFETPSGWAMSSFAFVERALTSSEAAALGTVDSDGPFDAALDGVNGVQFDFVNGAFNVKFGDGVMNQQVGDSSPFQLTGTYRGQQENLEHAMFRTPEVQFRAIAGDDFSVDFSEYSTAQLDGSSTIDPLSQIVSTQWENEAGVVIGADLITTILPRGGSFTYTLVVADALGRTSRDHVVVTGIDSDTILFDDFNDGNLDGWRILEGVFFAAGPIRSGAGTAEGRLQHSRTNNPALIVYQGALNDDYTLSALVNNESKQPCGLLVGYSDAGFYRFVFHVGASQLRLERVVGNSVSILAEQGDAGLFDIAFVASLSLSSGTLVASINSDVLFGGPVIDVSPALTGSAGFFHQGVYRLDIDNVSIRSGNAFVDLGPDRRLVDRDGNAVETIQLTPLTNVEGSTAIWRINGEQVGADSSLSIDLTVGLHHIELTLGSAYDWVNVEVFPQSAILLEDSFVADTTGWQFVDEGELGEPADWSLANGKLVQKADRTSRQLMGSGEETPTIEWTFDWSPLGDGFHVLRKGSYALWNSPSAMNWKDYSITIEFNSPSGGSVGVLFRYKDADNYLKLELDNAGGSSQLIHLKDGIEQIQWQSETGYDGNGSNILRVDTLGKQVAAFLDGFPMFTPVAFENDGQGTVAIYTWGAPGAEFESITVLQIGDDSPLPPPVQAPSQPPSPAATTPAPVQPTTAPTPVRPVPTQPTSPAPTPDNQPDGPTPQPISVPVQAPTSVPVPTPFPIFVITPTNPTKAASKMGMMGKKL